MVSVLEANDLTEMMSMVSLSSSSAQCLHQERVI